MPSRLAIHRLRREHAQALGFDVFDHQQWVRGDTVPCFNFTPGLHATILHRLHKGHGNTDSDCWGYQSPERLREPPVTSVSADVAPGTRFFRHMWATGRAILPIDGWFEWTWEDGREQPWYVQLRTGEPMFVAIVTSFRPYMPRREGSGFVIVETPDARGLVDLEDRRPLVLMPGDARRWIDLDTQLFDVNRIAREKRRAARHFAWHRVLPDANDPTINEPYLIAPK